MSEQIAKFFQLLQEGQIKGSRGTILQPLYFILPTIFIGIFLLSQWKDCPPMLIYILFGFSATIILIFIVVYLYFIFVVKNVDVLRSEKYQIYKKMIESKLTGSSSEDIKEIEKEFEERQLNLSIHSPKTKNNE